MASPALTEILRDDRTRDVHRPIRHADQASPPRFVPLRMNETLSIEPCAPRPGEVFVFRFRSQWQRISAHDAATWLTQDETRRAALLPSPALRYRYISSRAVLRLAVARLLGCEPRTVDLQDDAKGRLIAQAAGKPLILNADIGYAGVWIMLGISAAYVGLGTSLPSFGSATDVSASHTTSALPFGNQRARDNSLLSAAGYRSFIDGPSGLLHLMEAESIGDSSATQPWHIFDLPMPGQLCASICSSAPLNTIHAFGWSKRNENSR